MKVGLFCFWVCFNCKVHSPTVMFLFFFGQVWGEFFPLPPLFFAELSSRQKLREDGKLALMILRIRSCLPSILALILGHSLLASCRWLLSRGGPFYW